MNEYYVQIFLTPVHLAWEGFVMARNAAQAEKIARRNARTSRGKAYVSTTDGTEQ